MINEVAANAESWEQQLSICYRRTLRDSLIKVELALNVIRLEATSIEQSEALQQALVDIEIGADTLKAVESAYKKEVRRGRFFKFGTYILAGLATLFAVLAATG